jgi:hypothetical protein
VNWSVQQVISATGVSFSGHQDAAKQYDRSKHPRSDEQSSGAVADVYRNGHRD